MGILGPDHLIQNETFAIFAFSAVSGDWNQPSWKDVQAAFNGVGRTDLEWGHPVGVRNARKWDDCPKIDEDAIDGLDKLRCQGATCALKCKGGYLPVGRRRTKCRWNRKKQEWFWKNQLGGCRTCSVWEPTSDDPLMTTMCKVNPNTNRRWCKLECPENHQAADQNGRFVKIACKCPRAANRECKWYHRRRLADYANYECTALSTPPPATTAAGNDTVEA